MGLALGTNLKFYTSLSKGLKIKIWKFWGLLLTFVEVTGEKMVGGTFCPPPILNRVKVVFQCNTSQKYLFVGIVRSFSSLNPEKTKSVLYYSIEESIIAARCLVGCFKFNLGSIQPEVCQVKCQLMQRGKSFPDLCFIFCSNME